MLHERKLQDCHDVFFREVAKLIPELKNPKKIFFVTDDETAIVNALEEHFPNVDAYRCWNHFITTVVENWIRLTLENGSRNKNTLTTSTP
jgi:hypothetical protein